MYRVIKSKINMSLFGISASSPLTILVIHVLAMALLSNQVYISDWDSFEHSNAFANSEDYNAFMASMSHVFDLNKAAPLTSMSPPACF